VSLAWRELDQLMPQMLEGFQRCEELDLSNNRLSDVRALRDFVHMHTLILDNNHITSGTKFPKLPNLRTLWVNKNNITNLSIFIDSLVASTPGLHYLSMLGNEACPNYFNGGSLKQYQDYRKYVVSRLRSLTQLDSEPVTEEERREALRLYGDLATSVAFEEAEYEAEMEAKRQREEEKRQREKQEAERRRAEKIRKREQRKEAARLKRERETALAIAKKEEEERRDKERVRKLGSKTPSAVKEENVIASLLPEVGSEFDQKIPTPLDLPDIPDAGSLPSIAVADNVTDSEEWSSDDDWDE